MACCYRILTILDRCPVPIPPVAFSHLERYNYQPAQRPVFLRDCRIDCGGNGEFYLLKVY